MTVPGDRAAPPAGRAVPGPRRLLRVVPFLAALTLSAVLLVLNRDDLAQALRLLRHLEARWLVAAGLVEVAMLAGLVAGYVVLFNLAGYRYPVGRLTVVWLATNLVNQAIPSAGLAAAAFFVAFTPRSVPAGISLFAVGAHGYLDYLAFAGVAAVTLGIRAGRATVPWPILAAASLTVAVSLGGTLLGLLLLREREPVVRGIGAFLAGLSRTLGRVHRRLAFDPIQAAAQAVHAIDGLAQALRRGHGLLAPLALALGVQLLRPIQLALLARALHLPLGLLPAAAAYVSAGLATYWTFLPGGIGVYGGTMAEILGRRIPGGSATAISIAQRTLNFWVPMLAGAVCLMALQVRGRNRDQGPGVRRNHGNTGQ